MKTKPLSNIPKRKKSESKHPDSSSLLSSIIESPKDIIIFSLDSNYCYTAFNTNHKLTIKNIWGADIAIGMNMLKIIKDPKDRKKAKKNFDRTLEGESFTLIEEYGEPPNRFYYEDVYSPVYDENGQVTGLSLFLTDITEKKRTENELNQHRNQLEDLVKQRTKELETAKKELEIDIADRKQAEDELRETNIFLRNILDSSSSVSIISTDWEGNILYWNQGAEKIFGYKSEEIVGHQKIGILYPDDEEETWRIVKDIRSFIQKNKKGTSCEIVEITKDGRKLWAHLTLSPRLNKRGDVIGILGIGEDITERKLAEEANLQAEKLLKISEGKYRTIVESSHEFIWTTNRMGVLTFINKKGSQALGYEIEQLLGNDTSDFIHPDDLPAVREHFLKLVHEEQPQSYEFRMVNREGDYRLILINEVPIREKDKIVGVMAFGLDITDRRHSEIIMQTLRNLSHRLTESMDMKKLALIVAEEARKLFDYDAFSFDLLDEEKGLMVGVYNEDTPRKGKAPIAVSTKNIPLKAVKHKKPMKGLPHCINRKRLPAKSNTNPFGYDRLSRSLLYAPILRKGNVLGILSVQSYTLNKYRQEQLELLETFSDHVSGAIHRLSMEDSLKKSEEKYRTLTESAQESIFVIDREDRIEYVNNYGAAQFGLQPADLIGLQRSDFFPAEIAKEQYKYIQKVFRTGKEIYTENKTQFDKREVWMSNILVPLKEHNGKVHAVMGIARDITQRKQAEEELKESEERFRTIFEYEPECVKLLDENGIVLRMNPAGLKIVGADTTDQVEGKSVYPLLSPKYRSAYKNFNAMVLQGESGIMEYEIVGLKGVHRLLESHAVPIQNINGEITTILAVTRDITERKQAEKAIQQSEERFRSLAQSATDAIIIVNNKGRVSFFNHAAENIFGYKYTDMLNNDVTLLIPNEYKAYHKKGFSRYIKTGESTILGKSIELTGKRKNGDLFPIELSLTEIIAGEEKTFISIIRDITDRKQAEKVLQESEEKFRNVVEQSNDGIYVLQGNRFVLVNHRFTEITGFELEEISADDFDFKELIAEEGLKVLEEREEKRERGEDPPGRYIFKGLRKDGQKRDLEVSVTTVEWEGDSATLGVLHDVTNRIQNREKLEEALDEAKQGERVKALFMANMSHEIRTPLNAILGFTDLLETSVSDLVGKKEKEFFDTIRNSGNRLMQTVHEILDISQIDTGTYILNLKTFDLCKLIIRLLNEYHLVAEEKGLTMEYNSALNSAFIKADQNGVSQAISNIIDNAIKYTKQGKITVSLEQNAKEYVLSIQDTGIGIAEEYLENLFDVFSQESEGNTKNYQGIGLGMAIAKRHLDMNQISIDVESTKDVGTTFSLTFNPVKKLLPVKRVEKEEAKIKPTAEPAEKPLVLSVEDDPNSQILIELFLKEQYNICFAVSVDEAKEQLEQSQVDLILLDLSLVGDEDGLDLVKWMRKTKTWKKTPVIATTAHAFTTDQSNCIAAGCDNYISKPIKREKLLETISAFV